MIEYENLEKVNRQWENELKEKFSLLLQKGNFILGEEVSLFEQEFAAYCGSEFCVAVASGLDALYLSLKALQLPKGAEVIVPSNTYIATILSIINADLKPVLVEPDLSTYNIDPSKIKTAITSKTKAIVVVHLYGKPCEMDKITSIANEFELPIIEDCAQAHGASFLGKKIGTWGKFGAFSFYPTKNLGALGDGGAILTNDEESYQFLRTFRNYGSEKKYHNNVIGVNSRLDELQAAFLRIKLRSLDHLNEHKITLANLYSANIHNEKLILPVQTANAKEVFHIYNVRTEERYRLQQYLLDCGIKTEIHYPIPPHQQKGYRQFFTDCNFPVSELIHKTTLSLPVSYSHSTEDVLTVIDRVNKF